MILTTLFLLAVGAAAGAVVVLCFREFVEGLRSHRQHRKDYAVILKEHLDNGNVRVVGQVFGDRFLGSYKPLRYQKQYEARLDPDFERRFGGSDRIVLSSAELG